MTLLFLFLGRRRSFRFREGPDAEGVLDQGQPQGEGGGAEPSSPSRHRQQPDGRHHQPYAGQEGGGGSGPEPGRRHDRRDGDGGRPAAAVDRVDLRLVVVVVQTFS